MKNKILGILVLCMIFFIILPLICGVSLMVWINVSIWVGVIRVYTMELGLIGIALLTWLCYWAIIKIRGF